MRKVSERTEWAATGRSLSIRPTDDGRWCVTWKTPHMAASAFWYYDDQDEAFAVFRSMLAEYERAEVKRARLSDCLPGGVSRAEFSAS